ncbi:MAG: SDR family NAD(P)-dependent oxidoreductase, partial [Gammaproteobacteria bacterium]
MPHVVITGCSSGIGLEAALAFARAGYTVTATVRDPARATRLRERAAAEGLAVAIETLDVTQSATFAPFVERLLAREGRIDVLVNNAGVLPVGAFEDIPEDEFRAVMEANFFGPAVLSRAVLPAMRRQRSGCIIMLSSLSGMAARAGDTAYAASKFALEGLTEALRQEVARWNIRTALVHPAQYATG